MNEFNKGENVCFKGKYGIFYDVTIKKIYDNYATVKGGIIFGTHKVRMDKLYKELPKEYKEWQEENYKEALKAQRELEKFKNSR